MVMIHLHQDVFLHGKGTNSPPHGKTFEKATPPEKASITCHHNKGRHPFSGCLPFYWKFKFSC